MSLSRGGVAAEPDLLSEQYRVTQEPFWLIGQMRGNDGWDRIGTARRHDWQAIPSWDLDGGRLRIVSTGVFESGRVGRTVLHTPRTDK